MLSDGRDVSVRSLVAVAEAWEASGREPEALLANTGLPAHHLDQPNGWLSWAQFETFCANASTELDAAAWEALGHAAFDTKFLRIFRMVGWMLPDEVSLLRWVADQTTGPGGSMLPACTVEIQSHDRRHVEVVLLAPPAAGMPEGLAYQAKGALESLPTLLGQRPARAELRVQGERAVMKVLLPSRSHLRRAAAALTGIPLSAWLASRELRSMQEQLTEDRTQLHHETVRRRRAETERERLRARLAQAEKMEAIGRLAGGIAHDFNNLLTVIFTHAELAAEDAPEHTRSDLETIRSAAERAAALTEQLLSVGRRQPARTEVLVADAELQALEPVLRERTGPRTELVLGLNAADARIEMPRAGIERVLTNIVANAHEAQPSGGRVRIESARTVLDERSSRLHPGTSTGAHVCITISDDGVGMTAETRDRIFEPFFTTKENGSGLGMATVYGLVKQYGGYVTIYSEVGRGTTVKVYLPAVDAAEAEQPPSDIAPRAARGRTIWVAEDEEHVRGVVERGLREGRYRVRAFSRAEDLLGALSSADAAPDLILSDVVLPGVRGDELLAQVARSHPALPVILMSGYPGSWTEKLATVDREIDFLEKPFTIRQLLSKVQSALDRV